MICEFRIEALPVSYNKHFQIIWALKECNLTPEAHAYKNRVKMGMPVTEKIEDIGLMSLKRCSNMS